MFNIFSVFVRMAKNPHTIRKIKIDQTIDPKEIKVATMMKTNLLDQLQLCSATGAPQNLFAEAPSSFSILCPHLVESTASPATNPKKRPIVDPKTDPQPKKHRGPILNTTGNRMFFPKGLSKRYCADFLDSNSSCHHGDKCNFDHSVYPKEFPSEDIKLLQEHVASFDGLSFIDKKVS
jgi:hypothetical protein